MSVNSDSASTMDELTALQASYASKMGEKLVELKAVAELIIPGGRSEDIATTISELSGLVHKLSGYAKTFGITELGSTAKT